jgi:hypothetical protein
MNDVFTNAVVGFWTTFLLAAPPMLAWYALSSLFSYLRRNT